MYSNVNSYEIDKRSKTFVRLLDKRARNFIIPPGVLTIGDHAFDGCLSLESVVIPAGVTSIGDSAFLNCKSLESVEIPSSVTSIGSGAFCHCNLTSIKLKGNNPKYCSIDGVLFHREQKKLVAYPAGRYEEEYAVPNGVTSIDSGAFGSSRRLKSIKIPSSVISIGDNAFFGCSSLKMLDIPSSVKHIGKGVFIRCSSLTSIIVAKNNLEYCSIDGVLFHRKQRRLVAYPAGRYEEEYAVPAGVTSIGKFNECPFLKSAVIPSSVSSIDGLAFSGCSSLETVVIHGGMSEIGYGTFSGCSSLKSLVIPSSVTRIGDFAFASCYSLETIEIPSSVTSIGYHAFCRCLTLALHTPNGSYAEQYARKNGIKLRSDITYRSEAFFRTCIKFMDLMDKKKWGFKEDDRWPDDVFNLLVFLFDVKRYLCMLAGADGSIKPEEVKYINHF